MICYGCFLNSNHEGHNIQLHTSTQSGGCCDCGDEGAWSTQGCCTKHGKKPSIGSVPQVDPVSLIPTDMRSMMEALCEEFITNLTTIFLPFYCNLSSIPDDEGTYTLYLYDDNDRHSDDEYQQLLSSDVLQALLTGSSPVSVNINTLHSIGYLTLKENMPGDEASQAVVYLYTIEKYIVRALTLSQRRQRNSLLALVKFLTSLVSSNDGMLTIVVNSLTINHLITLFTHYSYLDKELMKCLYNFLLALLLNSSFKHICAYNVIPYLH